MIFFKTVVGRVRGLGAEHGFGATSVFDRGYGGDVIAPCVYRNAAQVGECRARQGSVIFMEVILLCLLLNKLHLLSRTQHRFIIVTVTCMLRVSACN